MPRLTYIGPIDGIDIPLLRLTEVRPGDEFDATDEQAERLLEQVDNYRLVDKAGKKSTPAPADNDAQEG